MNSALAATPVLGAQRPRHLWVPDYVKTYGPEAVELAELAGLTADEWQRFVVDCMLGVRADGKWAAFEVGLEVPRQNGKGGVYEIRELAGLFLFREQLLIHSAHEYKTAEQALDRMEALIDGCADLSREVKSVKRSHGQEGIYLKSGQVLRYFTRTASGGRGFSCDFLGLDEAMKIKHSMHAAMFPTMSARPNPQILYAGSAVDQETMDDGLVFARVRARGVKGGEPRLAFMGWSAPFEHPGDVPAEAALDPEMWAMGNPAFGIRVTADYVATEQAALSPRGFAVERLGVGDWPETDESPEVVIALDQWDALTDRGSFPLDPVCFTFDVTPEHSWAAIGVAGFRGDALAHVEVIEHRPGTDWVAGRLAGLVARHKTVGVRCVDKGAATALVPDLKAKGVKVEMVNAAEQAQAFERLIDAVKNVRVRHLGTPQLRAALQGARKRPLGDGSAWSRRDSGVDISPLMTVTLALWGLQSAPQRSRTAVFH